ncbi:hypothetical protein A2164_03530 [Candidatus Curtissbacteria bacterium RBG_13_35_7]|uniref:Uncharacterized protein n=1 Tax=Candidatus Curtissbacteria bacterium RBG_13_35_7 TaxID=1797705 RepID=A0A1F5G4C2_9BACT|nr:MAG: hypothetical protein A2164_03530 [Candidatus Curtissbacteria bacterium RBG_13_35_7]
MVGERDLGGLLEEAVGILRTPRSEISGVSIVNAAESIKLFRSIISDFLEDIDSKTRDNAQKISSMLKEGSIGIICEDGLEFASDLGEPEIRIVQVQVANQVLPTFIVPGNLNMYDLLGTLHECASCLPQLEHQSSYDYALPKVREAITDMAFVIKTAESIQNRESDE